MPFLPTRNLRDHIGPTIDQALREVVGDTANPILWDTCVIPAMTAQGVTIQGFLVLTTKAPTLGESITTMMSCDVRALAELDIALNAVRHCVDNIRAEQAKTLNGGQ